MQALAGVATGDELPFRLADIAVVVNDLHGSPRRMSMVNRITFSVVAILEDTRTAAGRDVDVGFHAVVFDAVLSVVQDAAQLVQWDL